MRKLKTVGDAIQRLKDRYALRDALIQRHNTSRSEDRRLQIRKEIVAVEATISSIVELPLTEAI